jgi:hypothetical protein
MVLLSIYRQMSKQFLQLDNNHILSYYFEFIIHQWIKYMVLYKIKHKMRCCCSKHCSQHAIQFACGLKIRRKGERAPSNHCVAVGFSNVEKKHASWLIQWLSYPGLYTVYTKLRDFSPQANYIDRATAEWRSQCQLLRIEGIAWSAQRISTSVNLGFLDPEPLVFRSCSSSVLLTRLSGARSRHTTSQKIW